MTFAQQLTDWRRELHRFPELSLEEVETTSRIRDWLQSAGIRLLPYSLQTGVVAEIGEGEKRPLRCGADIDALPIEEASGVAFSSQNPGVMHACGHDVHSSVMLGAALLLKQKRSAA
ncbi:Uncharacterized hydrolase YxeP [Cedecea neteri]|uniref:Uncharacterized hydrolase YxeP n=1 Tax=Cedecea neteri TaxID=158822 RepID=A0A2X3JDL9_9ENTR|nr:Uncharacterized hydrolase YxeP [Cedecea neteri]